MFVLIRTLPLRWKKKSTVLDTLSDIKTRKTISRAKGDNIIRLLKKEGDMNDYTPKFWHCVKSKGFQLISHSALGLKDVLCIPAKTSVSGKLCIFRTFILAML